MSRLSLLWLLVLCSCGLTRPLADEDFKLNHDREAITRKKVFLSEKGNTKPDAPNIIWIIVDDLGISDTDLYGGGTVPVPNINKLADQGIRFSNAYVTAPICGPSRAAILTGRYNQRFGFEHQQHNRYLKNKLEYMGFKFFVNSKPWYPQKQDSVPNQEFINAVGLPPSEITIAEELKKYGYHTGLFGKWHLGNHPDKTPNAFGFDEFYGFLNSHSLYANEEDMSIVSIKNKKDWTDKYIWADQREGLSAIERNGTVIPENRYLTTAITDEAIRFMDESYNPYFAVLSYNAPHTPFQAPKWAFDQWELENDPVKRVYAAIITALDLEIGRLVSHLEEAGQLENTLVFFISDNGGAEYTYATENGEYKGGKLTNFEGGLKVPMFITWPEKIKGGSDFEFAVSALDLFATTLACVTPDKPLNALDGKNLLTSLDKDIAPHDYLYFRRGYNHSVRSSKYKLIWNSFSGDSLIYDLKNDPYEQKNVFIEVPDEEKEKLIRAYQGWEMGTISPSWPPMIDFKYKDDEGNIYWFEN